MPTPDFTLYYAPMTRSIRVRWTLEEMGLPYKLETVKFTRGDVGGAEFKQINPMQKIPAFKDGDRVLLESLAIGQQWQGDVRVVLFVRLRDGVTLDAALEAEIRQVIRANATPRHVPAKIIAVSDIPRTRSGKIVELAVRNVVHGLPVKNTDALANPDALDQFRGRSELDD